MQPVYDTNKLEHFCKQNRAPSFINYRCGPVMPVRQQREDILGVQEKQTRQHAVVILCIMISSQSLPVSAVWLLLTSRRQLLHYHGLSDFGTQAVHKLGLGIGMRTFYKGSTHQAHSMWPK